MWGCGISVSFLFRCPLLISRGLLLFHLFACDFRLVKPPPFVCTDFWLLSHSSVPLTSSAGKPHWIPLLWNVTAGNVTSCKEEKLKVRQSLCWHKAIPSSFSVFTGTLLMGTRSCTPSMIQGKNLSLKFRFRHVDKAFGCSASGDEIHWVESSSLSLPAANPKMSSETKELRNNWSVSQPSRFSWQESRIKLKVYWNWHCDTTISDHFFVFTSTVQNPLCLHTSNLCHLSTLKIFNYSCTWSLHISSGLVLTVKDKKMQYFLSLHM